MLSSESQEGRCVSEGGDDVPGLSVRIQEGVSLTPQGSPSAFFSQNSSGSVSTDDLDFIGVEDRQGQEAGEGADGEDETSSSVPTEEFMHANDEKLYPG